MSKVEVVAMSHEVFEDCDNIIILEPNQYSAGNRGHPLHESVRQKANYFCGSFAMPASKQTTVI